MYFHELSQVAEAVADEGNPRPPAEPSHPRTAARIEAVRLEAALPPPPPVSSQLLKLGISLDPSTSAVPQTRGVRPPEQVECCVVVFFADGNREKKSKQTIHKMEQHQVRVWAGCPLHSLRLHASCRTMFTVSFSIHLGSQTEIVLVHTKEFIMKEVEAQPVFQTDSYNSFVLRGPLIVLYFAGELANAMVCAHRRSLTQSRFA